MQKAFTLYKRRFKMTLVPFPKVWRRAAFGNLGNIKKVDETPDTNLRGWNKAFTLIELLVVVLIIGILSAVALPQYQKAVWKSKATQLQIMVKSLVDAQTAYYLANGVYSANFSSLDIGFDSLPQHPSSSTNLTVASTDAIRANNEAELVINGSTNSWLFSVMLFKTGPYVKTGFGYMHVTDGTLAEKRWYCQEYKDVEAGKFCVKVMGLTGTPTTTLSYRYYSLNY